MRVRDARRNAPRQKGVTLAAGAAILASPVLTVASVASASSARPGVTKAEIAKKAVVVGSDRSSTALLSSGDTGEAVAAVQAELRIVADGIFGPQTEGAVKDFQLAQRMTVTGIVDAKTWAALFASNVRFYEDATASASASADAGAESVEVVFTESEPPAGGPDPHEHAALGDEVVEPHADGAPAPSAGTAPAPAADAPASPPAAAEPQPVAQPKRVPAAGSGCTADGRLVAPFKGTVTSPYGQDRGSYAHSGLDIAAPTGTPVRAAQCGTVSVSGTQSGYGTMVCIRHAGETTTCYAHMSQRDVSVNEYVRAGQKIGEVGCTGRCTGPHTHFEVRQGGTAQNPTPYLEGSRTVGGKTATTAASAGIGGATEAEQAATLGTTTGGTEAPAPAPTAEAPAPVAAAPAPVAQAPAPAVEAPAPAVEAPAPAVEAPAPAVEAPAPAVEAPAPAPEAPAPVAEAPAPAGEAPAPVGEEPAAAPAPEPAAAPAPTAEPSTGGAEAPVAEVAVAAG
jgi:Meckel syndrome type 1 protein